MIVDPSKAPHWTCSNGHVSRYFEKPTICPRACGSRKFRPATDADVHEDARSAKATMNARLAR
jgi:hypothetical protein